MGTRKNVDGLVAVPKPNLNRDKTKFEKALFVTRLSPTTTIDDVIGYITTQTPVTDKERINVHKLVKKDADLSKMQYISFKVELNADDLEVLLDHNLWPDDMGVREFSEKPSKVLGDFFPTLRHEKEKKRTDDENGANLMDIL